MVFYLYVDEFQSFATSSFADILSEARKYHLNLILANQYLDQIDEKVRDAIFGNVGTTICFKVGAEDAQTLVKEFAPVFNEYDLINIDKGTAYIKLLVENSALRPFSLKTLWPLVGVKQPGLSEEVRSLSRLKYGQSVRLVEAEISRRTNQSL